MNKSFLSGSHWTPTLYAGKTDLVDHINTQGSRVLCNLYLYIKLNIGLKEYQRLKKVNFKMSFHYETAIFFHACYMVVINRSQDVHCIILFFKKLIFV